MIKIRKATINDVTTISLLGRTTFSETFKSFFEKEEDLLHYLETTFSVAKIKHSLDKEENVYWIVVNDGLPIGYAKLKLDSSSKFVNNDKICQLQKIYVLHDYISMGIGKILHEHLIKEAFTLGYEYIWLSVFDRNKGAINFYCKKGYTTIGNHTFQIGSQVFQFYAMGRMLI